MAKNEAKVSKLYAELLSLDGQIQEAQGKRTQVLADLHKLIPENETIAGVKHIYVEGKTSTSYAKALNAARLRLSKKANEVLDEELANFTKEQKPSHTIKAVKS